MSVLLDLLTYNTYLNTFYLNMVASEMFLDTAQLRDSIVSHAKELNYLPRSFRSAQANVNISVTPSTSVTSVVIPSKTGFSTRIGSNTFNFVTSETIAITTSNNGIFLADNIILYEGSYVTDTFIKNDNISNQRFILNNPNIDTTSIEISVTENSGANVYSYVHAPSMFGVSSNSQVFFIQAAENEQYEVVFGDNSAGRTPLNGAVIGVTYRICNGELPNGSDSFINNTSIDGHSNVAISTNVEARNGSVSESNTSIKFNAPRSFQTQERAVTESDYETLLTREFPEIQAISVYGGEKINPPEYGKVYVSVDISNADGIPEITKQIYKDYLKDKTPIGITVDVVEPLFVYLSVVSNINYNYNTTTFSANELKTRALLAIVEYNNTYLNNFNANFRYSKFVSYIDGYDSSFINNDTDVIPYFLLTPILGTNTSFDFSFDTELLVTTPSETSHPLSAERGLYSTSFVVEGVTCQLEDDGLGIIRIVKQTADSHIEILRVGTVNYTTGVINITNLNVESYSGSGIKLYVKPISRDYNTTLQHILKIKEEDLIVTMTPVKS